MRTFVSWGSVVVCALAALACGPPSAADDEPDVDFGSGASSSSRGDAVVYLGVNSTSQAHETRGLEAQADVVRVTGSPKNGLFTVGGMTYDLRTDDGAALFLGSLELGERANSALMEMFRRTVENALDETAALTVLFADAEAAERPIRRLVLSGHSGGGSIGGEADGDAEIYFSNLAYLAAAFPRTAATVEHLAISACNTAYDSVHRTWYFEDHRRVFPNVGSIWAYKGKSPTIPGSTDHLKAWERGTRGRSDATTLGAARARAQRSGGVNAANVRVWTKLGIVGE